ncbi:MAG: c-type cytochrome [Novosphingobium sp.]
MRVARMTLMALGMAGLAACGGSKEPAAEQETTQAAGEAAAPAEPAAAAAPPQAFMQCVACHSPKAGVNGVGPSLFGVVGRKAGTLPGYAYSEALKTWGKTLTPEELDKWLTAPMQDVPGTKMVFPGMPDAAKRKEVIDYLATLK